MMLPGQRAAIFCSANMAAFPDQEAATPSDSLCSSPEAGIKIFATASLVDCLIHCRLIALIADAAHMESSPEFILIRRAACFMAFFAADLALHWPHF